MKTAPHHNNSNYSYTYHQLGEKLINGLDSYGLIQEALGEYSSSCSKELISYDDVSKCMKEELLPFIESIFNYDLFDTYVNYHKIDESSICESLSREFINFIHNEANSLAIALSEFKKGNEDLYDVYLDLENNLVKKLFLFVFQNTRFIGAESNYVLITDSNQYIKTYLNYVLIKLREKPKFFNSGVLQIEVNRVQTLILKNANFNFLNWYLIELKSAITDLKFIHKNQPNYGLKCSELIIKKLYGELRKYDFIDLDHTTENSFVDVFLSDWYSHDSICVLKMDNPQTKYFLDQFKAHIDSKITFTNIERAKNITNKTGYIISSSLSASSSRNKTIGPKREEDLLCIFRAFRS